MVKAVLKNIAIRVAITMGIMTLFCLIFLDFQGGFFRSLLGSALMSLTVEKYLIIPIVIASIIRALGKKEELDENSASNVRVEEL